MGWGTQNTVLREKTPLLHNAKQNHMSLSSNIQQSVKSIECSEWSLNLMNTNVLKDNLGKNIKLLYDL